MQWKLAEKKRVRLIWKKTDGTEGTATDVTAGSSNEGVATVEVRDGYAYLTNVAPGRTTITVAGDTDPGEGETNKKPVSNSFDVEILGDFAENLEFGEPEDQPAA
jgi:hypothetical protein